MTITSLVSLAEPLAVPSIHDIVAPVFEAAADSSSLLASRHPIKIAGREREIPKFLLLGQRGGGKPIRLALYAGLSAGESDTTAALARLLLQYELSPAQARDFALFAYPIVNGGAFEQTPLQPLSEREDPEATFFKNERRQWAFDGLITLRTDAHAHGFHAAVRSEVIRQEVALPALETIGRTLPLSTPAVAVRSTDEIDGKLTGEHPQPFEIEVYAPGRVEPEQRIIGLFLIVQEILRHYRKLMSHAPNL